MKFEAHALHVCSPNSLCKRSNQVSAKRFTPCKVLPQSLCEFAHTFRVLLLTGLYAPHFCMAESTWKWNYRYVVVLCTYSLPCCIAPSIRAAHHRKHLRSNQTAIYSGNREREGNQAEQTQKLPGQKKKVVPPPATFLPPFFCIRCSRSHFAFLDSVFAQIS